MTKVTATEAARQFSELMNRVKYQGQSFEIVRGNEIVARILPAVPSSPIRAEELNAFFASLPSLVSEDVDDFEKDLKAIREEGGLAEGDEWD